MSDRIDTLNSRIAEVRSRLGALHSNINTASSAQQLTAPVPAPVPVAFGQGQQQPPVPPQPLHTSAGASAGFIADASTYEHQGSVSPQAQPPSTHHLSSVVGMTPNGLPSGATAHGAAAAAGIGLFPQTPSAQTFHGQTPSRPVPPPIPPAAPTTVGQTPHQQGGHHGLGYPPQRDTAPRPPLAGHMGPHTSRGVAAPSPAVIDATQQAEHTGADQPSSSLPGGGEQQQQQQQQQQQSFFTGAGTPHQYPGASPSAATPGHSAAQPNSAFAALKQRLQLQQQPSSSPPYVPPSQPIVAAAAPRDPPPRQQFMDPATLAQQTQPLPHQTIHDPNHPSTATAAMPHHTMTMPRDTATAAAFFGAPTPQPLGSSGLAPRHHQPQQHRAPSSSTSPQGVHRQDADGGRGPSHEPASAPPAPTAAGGSFAEMQARLQSRLAQQMAEASAATQASVAAAHAPLSAPLAFDAVNQGQQQHQEGHHEQDHHHHHHHQIHHQQQQEQQVEQEPNALMRVHEASMSPSRDAQPPAPTPARPAGSLISGLVQGFSTPAQAGGQGPDAPRASNGAKTPTGKARPTTPQRGSNTAKGQAAAPTPARSSGSTTTKRKETSPPTGATDADRATNGLKMARPVTAAGVQPVAVTGAEVFAILRLRGVITTDPAATSGEHLLPPAAVHTMLLTPSEVQQLNQLRIALRKQHPPPRPDPGRPSPPPQQDSRSHSAQAADMYQPSGVPPQQPQQYHHQQYQQPDPQSNDGWVRGGGSGGGPQRGEAPSFHAPPAPSSKTPRQSRTPPRSQPAPSLRASEAALAAAERGKARRQAAGSSPAASSRWR